MKKIVISLLLAVAMLLSLAACSSANDMGNGDPSAEGILPNKGGMNYDAAMDAAQDAQQAAASVQQAAADLADQLNNAAGEVKVNIYEHPDYGKFVENSFIKVSENDVSTFSADVDTASYTYFRKMASQGYSLSELIRYVGQSVRTEEMINYFSYDYTAPASGQLFGVNSVITDCPWNSEAVLLTLGLRADDAIPSTGNNLVFLIDVSGSMRSSDKLELLKTAFGYLTEQLTEKDTVSIVTYSGREAVVLTGCPGNQSAKILKAVNNLEASGSTNGQAGLEKAYSIAADYFIEGGNNRIIMASDGDLNVGISSADELKKFVEQKRDAGIYLSVMGFGTGNYRDANMEALADNGNGVYYYIDGEAEAEKIFGTDLLGTLYTVAEDVKLQLTFSPEYIDSYRLVGYENRLLAEEDFDDDTKDAGEVGAGHTVTVCYELKLTDAAKAQLQASSGAGDEWMKLAVRYKNPGETQSLLNEYSWGRELYSAPSDDIKFMCAVIETSMLLHESKNLGGIELDDIIEQLDGLDLSGDRYKKEFKEILISLDQ
ncbi:MAG: VWA domain-containing protein [Clostridia bacterium]|nr:VWA domain-containing protein [Clostridia bacterium]